jgi:hypothetical protein
MKLFIAVNFQISFIQFNKIFFLEQRSERLCSSVGQNTKKKKRSDHLSRANKLWSSRIKRKLPMGHTGKTLLDYFKVIKRSSNDDYESKVSDCAHSSTNKISLRPKMKKRSATYFDGCIIIDDDEDDIQEIKQQR